MQIFKFIFCIWWLWPLLNLFFNNLLQILQSARSWRRSQSCHDFLVLSFVAEFVLCHTICDHRIAIGPGIRIFNKQQTPDKIAANEDLRNIRSLRHKCQAIHVFLVFGWVFTFNLTQWTFVIIYALLLQKFFCQFAVATSILRVNRKRVFDDLSYSSKSVGLFGYLFLNPLLFLSLLHKLFCP